MAEVEMREKAAISSGLCGRDKTWEERDMHEQVQLLRKELSRTQSVLEKVCNQLTRTDRRMSEHQHGNDGCPVVRIRANNEEEACGGVYFRADRIIADRQGTM